MSAFAVGSRVCFDPNWPMLGRCRELGTTGIDQVGTIVRINPGMAFAVPMPHWDSAVIAWDNGERSPVNLGNLVAAQAGSVV